MFFLYTVKLGMDEDSFFRSTLQKVVYLIEKWGEEERMKAEAMSGKKVNIPTPPKAARSIKEVLGHYGF